MWKEKEKEKAAHVRSSSSGSVAMTQPRTEPGDASSCASTVVTRHGHHRRLVYVENGDGNVRKSAQRHLTVLDHAHNNLQLPPISIVVK